MGLFLGMSTVTLLEIFIYLFKSIWGAVNTDRQKQFEEKQRKLQEEMHAKMPAADDQSSGNTVCTSSGPTIPTIELNDEEQGRSSQRPILRRPTRTLVRTFKKN